MRVASGGQRASAVRVGTDHADHAPLRVIAPKGGVGGARRRAVLTQLVAGRVIGPAGDRRQAAVPRRHGLRRRQEIGAIGEAGHHLVGAADRAARQRSALADCVEQPHGPVLAVEVTLLRADAVGFGREGLGQHPAVGRVVGVLGDVALGIGHGQRLRARRTDVAGRVGHRRGEVGGRRPGWTAERLRTAPSPRRRAEPTTPHWAGSALGG